MSNEKDKSKGYSHPKVIKHLRNIAALSDAMPVRVQLDMPAHRIKEIEGMREKCGLATRKDVFDAALELFAWAVRNAEAGQYVASWGGPNTTPRMVNMLALDRVKKAK